MLFMNDVILYHGSRGGLEGIPKPISRERCDFGKGFYLGEDPQQVKGLVIQDTCPVFYTLKLKLSEIPENRILFLNGMEWVYTVLANRKKSKLFNQLPIATKIINQLKNYDVVIGPIADDRMNEAIKEFEKGTLTDEGLLACLQRVNYGLQYVLKTEFACSKLEVLVERDIELDEINEIEIYANSKRQEGNHIVSQMIRKYRNHGQYLDELIEEQERLLQKNDPREFE